MLQMALLICAPILSTLLVAATSILGRWAILAITAAILHRRSARLSTITAWASLLAICTLPITIIGTTDLAYVVLFANLKSQCETFRSSNLSKVSHLLCYNRLKMEFL